jgi:phage-related protein
VLGALTVLLLIEMTADKIPAVDTINDGIQTFIRPVAGAILFAASAQVITDVHPILSIVSGLLIAGGVHTVKATARPVVTATTAGLGNPVVSVAEDIASAVVTVLAIILPLLTGIALLVLLFFTLRWLRRRRSAAR